MGSAVAAAAASPPLNAHTVPGAGGVNVACWRAGTGAPLLLVHGTGQDHRRWAPVMAALATEHAVHALDRRGRGASGDAESYALADEVADIAAVARAIGPAPGGVAVIAHSYGAICALEAAAAAPEIGPLVLFEPPVPTPAAPGPPQDVADRVQALADAGDAAGAMAVFLRDVVRVPAKQVDMLRRVPGFGSRARDCAGTVAREIAATRRYVPDPRRLRQVRGPVLLLTGEHSPVDIQAGAAALHAALPGSRLRSLAGQAHHAIDTAPTAFLAAVRPYLPAPAREGTG